MTVTTSDIVWQVEIDGKSSAPLLVMLHGFAQTLNSFAPHVAELREHFRVVRLDLPGHGQTSTAISLDWATLCASLHEAVSQIDSRPAHWFGYSQGGRVALIYALRYQETVKSLALLGASPGLRDASQREARIQSDRLLGQNIVRRGMAWFTEYWEALPIFASQKSLPESTREQIRAERMACSPEGLQFALETFGTGTMPDYSAHMTAWQKPLCLMAGELDSKFVESNERIARASQSSLLQHHKLPECGHAAHLERPIEFTTLLTDFIHAAEGKIA